MRAEMMAGELLARGRELVLGKGKGGKDKGEGKGKDGKDNDADDDMDGHTGFTDADQRSDDDPYNNSGDDGRRRPLQQLWRRGDQSGSKGEGKGKETGKGNDKGEDAAVLELPGGHARYPHPLVRGGSDTD